MNYLIIGIIAIAVISGLNIVCFFIGAKVGQKVVKGEDVQLPNPIKAVHESIETYKETKEAEKEQNYYDTILHNIDVYDGSPAGQREIPM